MQAISVRNIQLSQFHGEKTSFKTKILVSHTKIYEFSQEKFLIFPMKDRKRYDVPLSHFSHLRAFGKKVILQKFSILWQNQSLTFL